MTKHQLTWTFTSWTAALAKANHDRLRSMSRGSVLKSWVCMNDIPFWKSCSPWTPLVGRASPVHLPDTTPELEPSKMGFANCFYHRIMFRADWAWVGVVLVSCYAMVVGEDWNTTKLKMEKKCVMSHCLELDRTKRCMLFSTAVLTACGSTNHGLSVPRLDHAAGPP